jgi:hypothetical protein|tara:strand:- start:5410 stop:5685 length:276 start_codon:yes stop_codon:yes gene_type:complete
MTDDEIEKLAEKLIKKLMSQFEKDPLPPPQPRFIIQDELGEHKNISEHEYLLMELDRLYDLEGKYVAEEEYEKAAIIQNKIKQIRLKISKL